MQIRHLQFKPDQLDDFPKSERALFVVLAHALNEINTINRLVAIGSRYDDSPRWKVHTSFFQALTLSKVLVGKLHEAWQVITKAYHGQKLGTVYGPKLDDATIGALNNLQRYFGRVNVITTVRNSFAFHYDLDHAASDFPSDAAPDDISLYLHKHNGNCLYQFAELAMNVALLDGIESKRPEQALTRLLSEMTDVVAWMNVFGQGLMIAMLQEHILSKGENLAEVEIDVGEVPSIETLQLPFFIHMPDRAPTDA